MYATEDEEDAFLAQLIEQEKQERAQIPRSFLATQSYSMSESSSESSIEEEETEECEFSRAFFEYLAFNHANISQYELANLVTSTPSTKKKKHQNERPIAALDDFLRQYEAKRQLREPRLRASPEDMITDEERKRIKHTVTCPAKNVKVEVMVENYVYVTYFCNRYTKEDYLINLNDLARQLLRYGVQYSDNKFTKVTLKYTYGPSHYFFRSGAMVESGTYNPIIARKTHNMSIRLLREECGFDNIEIKKRKCHNIVAKGTLKFPVSLEALKAQYPFVQYDEDKFAGAIIRLNKMPLATSKRRRDTPKTKKLRKKKCRIDTSHLNHSIITPSSSLSEEEEGESDEDEEEADESHNPSSSSSSSSSGEYEYFDEADDDRRYNENFEYLEVDETTLAEIQRQSGTYRMAQKKTLKKRDILQLHQNPYELTQYERDALMKKKNVTILVFKKGRIICAGCRKTRNVLKAYATVLPMLAACIEETTIATAKRTKKKSNK